jgi:hypothetical protein
MPATAFFGCATYDGRLPPSNFSAIVNQKTRNAAEGSAFYALLPYYEQDNLFRQYTQDRPDAGYLGTQYVPLAIHVCPSDPTTSDGIAILGGKIATSNYALNLALFGTGGTFNIKGKVSPYRICNIPDGTSNTIGLVETSGCFPGYPTVNPQSGTQENYMSWPWPAYPNSFGPYWPNPDELPGLTFVALRIKPSSICLPFTPRVDTKRGSRSSTSRAGRWQMPAK